MHLRYLSSSTVVVESGEYAVLCDPWLVDGAFYGAWAQYPPPSFEPEAYDDVDYIYISDAYPDHFHRPTMARLDTETPVLIHEAAPAFLRDAIEGLGFDVTELPLARRAHLTDELSLTIVGADRCGPTAGGTSTESEPVGKPDGGQVVTAPPQPDTLAVFDDGDDVLVDANGCQWPLAEEACSLVEGEFGPVDMLLVQSAATNCYPQCMLDYSHEEKLTARGTVISDMYRNAEGFINALEPDHFMPFAGSYLLSGPLADRNEYVAAPTQGEAFWHFLGSDAIDVAHSKPVVLNSEAAFDISAGKPSTEFSTIDHRKRSTYTDTVLAQRSLDYETDERPTVAELTDLLDSAYQTMNAQRRTMGWASDTTVLLELGEAATAALSMCGDGYEVYTEREPDTDGGYVRFDMDERLLARILRGPEHARFQTAHVGSHIDIEQSPAVYERPLYEIMNHLHT